MQTMDMILAKKKRIQIEKRNRLKQPNTTKNSIWGLITSVTNKSSNSESEFILNIIKTSVL
jgi:Ethanolamine utilization protein EutJ (predicted chaperonin)